MRLPRFPLVPTIVVLAACATMVALGVWQLGRAEEKEALLASYQSALTRDGEVAFPRTEDEVAEKLYRRSTVTCANILSTRSTASRDTRGDSGLAQVARCELKGGGVADIHLGWTARPTPVDWKGGTVSGTIARSGDEARLVADPPAFGLAPLPKPDPSELPNNHLAYAGQWFFFALTALIIYVLALRRQQRA